VTQAVRARRPQRSKGTLRARTRSFGTALALVAAGAVLGWALPLWERHLPAAGLHFDASTAQATLAAIAGGMITLAGFVVTAITLVVQTVQAMSPRLVAALGHFSRYLVLFGLLIGTALYSLVALSHVRGNSVPRVSVTVAVGLVLIDAVTVLSLLASLRHAVTGGGLARAVGQRLRAVIDQTSPAHPQTPFITTAIPEGAGKGEPIVRRSAPAVLHAIDEQRLTRLAARHRIRVHLLHTIGDFIRADTLTARVEADGDRIPDRRLLRRVQACMHYGPSRTVEQDTGYGFRLLADIAVRALSPAVNDPTTAVQALDQIEDGLLRLANRPLGPAWLLDPDQHPRVFLPAPRWPDLVGLALDEALLYGAANPQTARRLRTLLNRLLASAPEDRKAPLLERRDALSRMTAAALPDPLFHRLADHPDLQGHGDAPATDPDAC
jgi:uncharacterized membrane protein